MDMGLGGLWEFVTDREAWRAAFHRFTKNWTWLSDWTDCVRVPCIFWDIYLQILFDILFANIFSQLYCAFDFLNKVFHTVEIFNFSKSTESLVLLSDCFFLCRILKLQSLWSAWPNPSSCQFSFIFSSIILNTFAFKICLWIIWGFPGGLVVENLPVSAGDVGLIPGLGTSSGGGNGNSL